MTNVDLLQQRSEHAQMEDSRSESYIIMADSEEYRPCYDPYIAVVKEYCAQKNDVQILNIGAASGELERLVLATFPKVRFVCIDNSQFFAEKFKEKNEKHLVERTILYKFLDIQDYAFDRKFDIIIARDFNHHLERENVKYYIPKGYSCLNEGGTMIIEDVRQDAPIKGIHDFIDLVCRIPQYSNDRVNLRHKIMGILESFEVAYTSEEMCDILDEVNIPYDLTLTNARYGIIVRK